VIPAKARKIFNISAGDQLVVLGDETQGMAIRKAQDFLSLANMVMKIQDGT
jgi:AbrB family looped-hinge helix DNA binding protein